MEIGRNYGFNEWREDMKNLVRNASTPDHNVIFLFAESQVKKWDFILTLEYIINLLICNIYR